MSSKIIERNVRHEEIKWFDVLLSSFSYQSNNDNALRNTRSLVFQEPDHVIGV